VARNLESRDIPEAAKTVRVDVFDADGVRTGARDERATYFWREPNGDSFVSQTSAREKGMFEIDELDPPATIQVNKYGINGDFLGGPWRVRDI